MRPISLIILLGLSSALSMPLVLAQRSSAVTCGSGLVGAATAMRVGEESITIVPLTKRAAVPRQFGLLIAQADAAAKAAEENKRAMYQQICVRMQKSAEAAEKIGNLESAAKQYRELAELRERIFGMRDTNVAEPYLKSGLIERKLERNAAADYALRRALAACLRTCGSNSMESGPILKNLADVCVAVQDFRQAASAYRQLLSVQVRWDGAESSYAQATRVALAKAEIKAQNYPGAEPILREAVEISSKSGDSDDKVRELMGLYATVLRHNNKAEEADKMMEAAQAMKLPGKEGH